MKLVQLTICNFQSFGEVPTVIDFVSMTFIIGSNGTGKTAVLQALARMFGVDQSLRRIRHTDFHVPIAESVEDVLESRMLWIEADFEFPEVTNLDEDYASIPANFAHMQLESENGIPKIRFRLDASMDEDGDIEESLSYVIRVDEIGDPLDQTRVQKQDRNAIQVHYLPARRDPAEHISYTANSMLGRVLRAANWQSERSDVAGLTEEISDTLSKNDAITEIDENLKMFWDTLHKGVYYADPHVSFNKNEIENLLRHLTVRFTPTPTKPFVDFSRLSDGQQSLLYLSLVLSIQEIGRKVLDGELDDEFDINKLRPAVFTLIAMEEPENSLSPHYLGRVINLLKEFSQNVDAQAMVATHAPAMLKRVQPEQIRYLRLNKNRETIVKSILMPQETTEAYKFVREAVQAFPELYFSRLVIFGEGDSEEIVLPRLLQTSGLLADEASISVVPLGGRHVNHFWRLVHDLGIPQVTLLDLDLARYQGGWGRIRYVIQQLLKFPTIESNLEQSHLDTIPKWDGETNILTDKNGKGWIKFFEGAGVYFSSPLDLDFMMLRSFGEAYDVDMEEDSEEPDESIVISVLGKKHGDIEQYSDGERAFFEDYHTRFKLGSKPAWHLKGLAALDDDEIISDMPEVLDRMFKAIKQKLSELPE